MVDNDATVITNHHVIRGATKATATFVDGSQSPVLGVLAIIPEYDLAALRIDVTKTPTSQTTGVSGKPIISHRPLRLSNGNLQKGEKVVAFGMPEGLSFSTTEGIVSSIRTGRELGEAFQATLGIDITKDVGISPDSRWVQSSAPISHGNSGGPLVNMCGEVVGVNSMLHPQGQNLNFAVAVSDIERLLTAARSPLIPLDLLPKPKKIPIPREIIDRKDTLMGLAGVIVVCETVPAEASKWGMDTQGILALVERKLRGTGIRLLSEGADDWGGPAAYLTVKVDAIRHEQNPVLMYVCDCEVDRYVAVNPLAEDHLYLTRANVWRARSSFGYAGSQVFEAAIRRNLERMLDEFADAFLAVNNK